MGSRTILFNSMIMDSQLIGANQTTYDFFTENSEEEASITQFSEEQAFKWLLRNPHFRRFFLQQFLPDPTIVKAFLGVKEPLTAHHYKPGDVDLLLVNP